MENINRLRREYELLNNLCKLRNENHSSDLCNEISRTNDELLKIVGDLLSNELNQCTCDGIYEGCSSLLCKSHSKSNSESNYIDASKSSVEDNLEDDMIYDDRFYVTIPQIPYLKSYMFRSLSEFNNNCFIEMYEFGKNDFILPLALENLIDNGISFDIQIRKGGCGYTEIWKGVKLSRVHRQELRRREIGCSSNPTVLYIEGEFESKEYIENVD